MPKCGHILLTESQYAKCQTAIRVVRIYNVIVFPYHIFKYLTSKEYREVKVVTKVELQVEDSKWVRGIATMQHWGA